MSSLPYLAGETLRQRPTWRGAVDALIDGHRFPRARITDTTLARGEQRMMSRLAWIDGLGSAVKSFTVYPENPRAQPPRPSAQGGCLLLDDATGAPVAMVEFSMLTWWKTAADSVLGALLLGPSEPRSLVIIGAGPVARSLGEAYAALFPSLERITVCARRLAAASSCTGALSLDGVELQVSDTPERAVPEADIVATATTSSQPVLHGKWLKPGAHVDLVGAYASTMREADDEVLTRGSVYVDSRATTVEHIGELMIPLTDGVLKTTDIKGDFYDLLAEETFIDDKRARGDAITVFKNGGGAHLDLMICKYLQSLTPIAGKGG
ncbi:MAG: ornithine cyclodeaminase [Pseudomonadota bacterium]